MARTTFVRGPGLVVKGAAAIRTLGDIAIKTVLQGEPVDVAYYGGTIARRASARYATVSFTPAGEFDANVVAALWPHASKKIGDALFPGTDEPLIVLGADGTMVTYAACALRKCPGLLMQSKKPVFKDCEFYCLGQGDVAWSTASSLVEYATAQTLADTTASADTFDVADIVRATAYGNWPPTGASSPWANFYTVDGFDFDFQIDTEESNDDKYGIQNITLKSVSATCEFTPVGILASDAEAAMNIQGSNAALGKDISSLGKGNLAVNMGLTANKLTCTMMSAAIDSFDNIYGVTTPRVKIHMIGTPSTSSTPTVSSFFTVARTTS